MLKRFEEQDDVFTIIEKGNYFTPTKGVETESVTQDMKPSKVKKVLKIVVIILLVAGFIALGVETISNYYVAIR